MDMLWVLRPGDWHFRLKRSSDVESVELTAVKLDIRL